MAEDMGTKEAAEKWKCKQDTVSRWCRAVSYTHLAMSRRRSPDLNGSCVTLRMRWKY